MTSWTTINSDKAVGNIPVGSLYNVDDSRYAQVVFKDKILRTPDYRGLDFGSAQF